MNSLPDLNLTVFIPSKQQLRTTDSNMPSELQKKATGYRSFARKVPIEHVSALSELRGLYRLPNSRSGLNLWVKRMFLPQRSHHGFVFLQCFLLQRYTPRPIAGNDENERYIAFRRSCL